VNEFNELPGRTGNLTELRVLFLPKNSRTGYFQSLLRAALEAHGWSISVLCPPGGDQVWTDAIGARGRCIELPDFAVGANWERDASDAAEIRNFVTACERASGVSVGRVILAGERDIGRGFSWTNFYWFHDRMARRVLADNTEPERVVTRMFAFARETLLAVEPDLVLAGEWADPLCFVFYLAAYQMGIPTVANRKSKLWTGRCFWSAELEMYNHAARTEVGKRIAVGAATSARASERLAAFRAGPDTLGYVKENWDALDRRGSIGKHVEIARHLAARLRQRKGGPPAKPGLRLLGDIYRRAWLKFRQARFFQRFDDNELRGMRYVLIALHKDPEQALNQQAYVWANQFNTVSLISSSLPDGTRLLVREHRNNVGRRPTEYYNSMRILPGVVLVDSFDDQFKYIRNADAIVTENGSTGWEGLVLGRQVITLADNHYDGSNCARRVIDHDQLSSALIAALEQPAVGDQDTRDLALGRMLDAEWETSAPLEREGHGRTLTLLDDLRAQMLRPAEEAPVTA
jgi:hypothetical protein